MTTFFVFLSTHPRLSVFFYCEVRIVSVVESGDVYGLRIESLGVLSPVVQSSVGEGGGIKF